MSSVNTILKIATVPISLTSNVILLKILLVIRFQILERTETAGGPEGPPLILCGNYNVKTLFGLLTTY